MLYNALYARQSVERERSVSVETQLEYAHAENHGDLFVEYVDRGLSGKNTDRPNFMRMMDDVQAGKVKKVIVYRLDRISRSVMDFENMMNVFHQFGTEFVSCTEKFDTSTPIGRAMLNIAIVFAQLERETIQSRIADAYASRCRRGFYMGGPVPYGFRLSEDRSVMIDGKRTRMLEVDPKTSEQVKLMYSLYANPLNSLADVVRYLFDHKIYQFGKKEGAPFPLTMIGGILKSPIYVQADLDVYNFLKSQGTELCNPPSDYIGTNGIYLFTGSNVPHNQKKVDLPDQIAVLAPHQGFIPSDVWLKCRLRRLNNRHNGTSSKPHKTWLAGKVKCGSCGYALVAANSYFFCTGKTFHYTFCQGLGTKLRVDDLQARVLELIREKLREFESLSLTEKNPEPPAVSQNKVRIVELDDEIEKLMEKVPDAGEVLLKYINERITLLETERQALLEQNVSLRVSNVGNRKMKQIRDHVDKWESISFDDKRAVVAALIEVIKVRDHEIDITWKV